MRRLVVGDIHGNYRALLQCLDMANFDNSRDMLICLGDYCDGYPDVAECLYLLSHVPNKVLILGNHDNWVLSYLTTGVAPQLWINQGGKASIDSLKGKNQDLFIKVLKSAVPYYETDDKKLFVHGGIRPDLRAGVQGPETLLWDRGLVNLAYRALLMGWKTQLTLYDEVFIGHTDTNLFGKKEPFFVGGVWALDQGAGWNGRLTIMDVDTKKFWQSDEAYTLYKNNARFGE